VAWWVLAGRSEQIAGLGQGVSPSLRGIVVQGWELVLRTALAIAGALAAIAVLDYILQRLRFERSLRMTREEVKEEIKREEGDPQVKARIRRLQRDAAQRRMLRAVPTASVIITNPEHVAVALQYDRATMPAPRVVAKGAGRVAKRIIELGRKSAVPVVERKPLAQALFRTVEVGREIPAGLYFVVAEVLAFVYRQREAA
jgi:flagellar biosynthetic protein FlhB